MTVRYWRSPVEALKHRRRARRDSRSASDGASRSRAETRRSPKSSGHSIPTPGSSKANPLSMRRVVVGRDLVGHVGELGQHAEPVSEPVGHVELAMIDIVEDMRLPVPELRRSAADIDDYVEDRASGAADQLGLPGLVVHAPHDPLPRARMVVLDELVRDAQSAKRALAKRLNEEAALIAHAPPGRWQQDQRALSEGCASLRTPDDTVVHYETSPLSEPTHQPPGHSIQCLSTHRTGRAGDQPTRLVDRRAR